jgi:UDP-2,3-diacylglucosamine hydrolase
VLQAHGRRVLLTHGDQLCLGDVEYLRFRSQVRLAAWQAAFLARPLEERHALAQAMRDASRQHQRDPVTWADVDPAAALAWLQTANCDVLLHGHTHRPGMEPLAPGFQRLVLTDWDLDSPGPVRAQVLRLTSEGFARLPLDG